MKWTLRSKPGRSEGYSAQCEADELELIGESKLSLAFAEAQWKVALASGRWAELLGSHTPRFPHRALWLPPSAPHLVEWAVECGFNTAILGARWWEKESRPTTSVEELRAAGLNVWLFGTAHPVEEGVSALLHLGSAPPLTLEATRFEQLIQEIRALRTSLSPSIQLIYILSPDPSLLEWEAKRLEAILDEVPEGVTIAFPAAVGEQLHPIWRQLRATLDTASTPLLPIFDPSRVDLQFEQPLMRHPFAGGVVVGGEEPAPLWAAGQLLWRGGSYRDHFKTWELAGLATR